MAAVELPLITTSERRSFKRCPQRWWWGYREGLISDDMSSALWFGIGIHEALAALYQLGKKRDKNFIDVWRTYVDQDEISRAIRTKGGGQMDDSEWVNARQLGESMLQGYVDLYNYDKDWDVIYTEEPFKILIPDPGAPSRDIAIFASTFDGVYRYRSSKKCYLMEHKTAASISIGHLPMDDQGGSYWAVATQVLRDKGILSAKERIHGINYNFLRKALPDDRPKDAEGYATNKPVKEHYLAAFAAAEVEPPSKPTMANLEELAGLLRIQVLGDRSKSQPAPLYQREMVIRTSRERATQIRRIGAEVHAMNQFRNGEVEVYKNPTQDCAWDCAFYNLCQLHEQQADYEEFKKAVFTSSDPYGRYRLRKSA